MTLKWTQELSVKNSGIDAQHQKLVEALNRFMEATAKGQGRDKIPETVEFLGKYATEHFTAEEKYMADHKYPGLEQHKVLHKKFLGEFIKFKEKMQKEGATSSFAIELQSFLSSWLLNHIKTEDKKYADFIGKT